MFYPIHNIIMLDFFRNQHSKTECTVRSFGLIATCCMKTSSVQGVHHAGVAVELELLLKKKLVVMVIPRLLRALRLLFYFTTYNSLAECNEILLAMEQVKDLHYAGVAAKMTILKVKCLDIFSFSSLLFMAEYIWNLGPTDTMSMMKTSVAKVLHHTGVAAKNKPASL